MKSTITATFLMLACAMPAAAQVAPDTTRVVIHGIEIPDPWRRLEQTDAPDVLRWLRQQDSAARKMLRSVAGADAVHARVRALASVDSWSVPQFTRDALYLLEVDGRSDERRIVRRDRTGSETMLRFADRPADGAQLANFAPDPDGRLLLYELHHEASGTRTLVLGDIAADGDVRERFTITNAVTSERPWLRDGSGFVAARDGAGPDTVFLFRIDTPAQPEALFAADDDAVTLRPRVSDDGTWLVISASSASSSSVHVLSLNPRSAPVRLAPAGGAAMDFVGVRNDSLLFRTDAGAPTGRVVAVDPRSPQEGAWQQVVAPRPDATLRAAMMAGGTLLLSYLEGPAPFLVIRAGETERRVDVPLGLLWTDYLPGWPAFSTHSDEQRAYFRSINLSAPGIYEIDVVSGTARPWRLRETGVDPALFESRIETYTSADGTSIPLFLIGRRDRAPGPHPTLVFAYGAYGFTAIPFFNAKYVTFIEDGGTFAIPFTRGDGVFGEAWHRAGTGAGKMTTIADLNAAAEFLIARGYATATSLGIEGQGPGGMVAASAVLLRPELWAAATLEAPVTDPVRMLALRGRPSAEYGDLADSVTVRALRAFGPAYQPRSGLRYPAILLRTGDRDRTVAPFHSYKLAAALRAAAPDGDAYLRISWAEAHGFLRAADLRSEEWADDLVFLRRFLRVH